MISSLLNKIGGCPFETPSFISEILFSLFLPANCLLRSRYDVGRGEAVLVEELLGCAAFAESIHNGYILMRYRALAGGYAGYAVAQATVYLVLFGGDDAAGLFY